MCISATIWQIKRVSVVIRESGLTIIELELELELAQPAMDDLIVRIRPTIMSSLT